MSGEETIELEYKYEPVPKYEHFKKINVNYSIEDLSEIKDGYSRLYKSPLLHFFLFDYSNHAISRINHVNPSSRRRLFPGQKSTKLIEHLLWMSITLISQLSSEGDSDNIDQNQLVGTITHAESNEGVDENDIIRLYIKPRKTEEESYSTLEDIALEVHFDFYLTADSKLRSILSNLIANKELINQRLNHHCKTIIRFFRFAKSEPKIVQSLNDQINMLHQVSEIQKRSQLEDDSEIPFRERELEVQKAILNLISSSNTYNRATVEFFGV